MKGYSLVFLMALMLISCKEQEKEQEHSEIQRDKDGETVLKVPENYPTLGFIERYDDAISKIIPDDAEIEILASGFEWAEGPVWLKTEQSLLFSDVPKNKIYKWNHTEGLSTYMTPSGYTGNEKKNKGSNGLTLNAEWDLIICQEGDRVVSRLVSLKDSLSPVFETLVTNYKGKRFNSPNDIVFDKVGGMYFTDPPYGLGEDKSELGFNGIFYFNKEGELSLIDGSLAKPNGVVVSHDDKVLYVAESNISKPIIWAYDIVNPGVVENKRVFFDATEIIKKSEAKQNPDGIKLDIYGNIFVAAADGVLVIDPKGKLIGGINVGRPSGNCEFSDTGNFIFITADDHLLRVNLMQ